MNRIKTYVLWAIKIIISALFLIASSGKLAQHDAVIDMFRNWGYFDGFHFIIGILEFSLAVLLLIRKTAWYAAIGLIVIMVGALITHLIHDPMVEIIRPLIFMLFLGAITYMEKSLSKRSPDTGR